MGRVTVDRCEHWRGLVALAVVGQLDEAGRVALGAHLEGCPDCRTERAELASLERVLGAADPSHLVAPELPDPLARAVVTRLRADARRDRVTSRLRAVALSAAAAAVVALGVVVGLQPWSAAPGRTIALSGPGAARATVRLVPQSWGTEVQLQEWGAPGGQVLTVSMRNRAGRWWDAGTYRTVAGRSVRVDMACAVPAAQVYAVFVRDTAGHVVLRADST